MNGINSMAKKCHGTFASVTKSSIYFSLLYLGAILFTEVSSQTQGLTLTLPQGEVRGTFETYRKNNDDYTYSVFRGIPYAKPPVESLRLKVNCIFIKFCINILRSYIKMGLHTNLIFIFIKRVRDTNIFKFSKKHLL